MLVREQEGERFVEALLRLRRGEGGKVLGKYVGQRRAPAGFDEPEHLRDRPCLPRRGHDPSEGLDHGMGGSLAQQPEVAVFALGLAGGLQGGIMDPKFVAAAFGMTPEATVIYLADRVDSGCLDPNGGAV